MGPLMIQELPTDMIGLAGFVAMLIFLWVKDRRDRRAHAHQVSVMGEVREQVSNTHSTNLRDDIDRLIDAVATVDERTRRIGDDQRREVEARRDGDRRIGDHLARIDARLDRQDRIADKHHPGEV